MSRERIRARIEQLFKGAPKKLLCPVCRSPVAAFKPLPDYYYENLDRYGYIHSIFLAETINRLAYSCPECSASDRSRLYALYIDKYLRPDTEIHSILDIAPARSLSVFIKDVFPRAEYRRADLYQKDVDDLIDITDMRSYADGRFDFLLCSHVLEHVHDDRKALTELFRVLRPGGKGIVMVPINLGLTDDYENPEIITAEGRWQHFGQHDHVRIYSKQGFTGKLLSAGFMVEEFAVNDFGAEVFQRHGIHPRSVLYLANKPLA